MAYALVYTKVLNQEYRGHAERCSYTFVINKPDQLGARWSAIEHMEAHITALREDGSIVLEYRLWEDKSPTWSTKYYCTVVASASVIAWVGVILLVVALIGLVLVSIPLIREIKDIIKYGGAAAAESIKWTALATIAIATVAGLWLIKGTPKSKLREVKHG